MKLFAIVVIYNALALLVMCDNLEFLDSSESNEIGETNQTNGTLIDILPKNQSLKLGKQIFKNLSKHLQIFVNFNKKKPDPRL